METVYIYAVEMFWEGQVVSSCGLLTGEHLPNFDELEYTDKLNGWLRENNDRLVLMR